MIYLIPQSLEPGSGEPVGREQLLAPATTAEVQFDSLTVRGEMKKTTAL